MQFLSAAAADVDQLISGFEKGYFSPPLMAARLLEELGEVARVFAHQNGKTPKAGEDEGSLSEELADMLFVLLCAANASGAVVGRSAEKTLAQPALFAVLDLQNLGPLGLASAKLAAIWSASPTWRELPESHAQLLNGALEQLARVAVAADVDLQVAFDAIMHKFATRDAERWAKKSVPQR